MGENGESKGVGRRVVNTLDKTVKIVLGIEVDPTAKVKTSAEIALGKAGSGHDPFTGYAPKTEYKGGDLKNQGVSHFKELEASTLGGKAVRIRACKTKVLKSYDKDSGKTTFKGYLTTTEEMLADIHVFRGDRCLTGKETFDEVRNQMKKTRSGMNKILIRLSSDGSSIKDCIIDGVVHWEGGVEKAKTGR